MYPKLILRNVFRNLQTYTIYFFSLTLIYSLLYAFNALPSHPVMQSLSGAKEMLTTVMSQYMGLLSYLILSAIAFLVVYSTNFVLGRRKKELGLYATLGMKKKQIIRTLFFETMLVNIFSLILGFLLGVFLLVILAKIASEFFMAWMMSKSSNRISPDVGLSIVEIQLRSVVFPLPLAPIIARNSPFSTDKFTSDKA